MKTRDFLRLPVGSQVDIADSFYTYVVKKFLNEDGEPIYSVREKQRGQSFTMVEREEYVFEDSTKYKEKTLAGCTNVCGFFFHEENMRSRLGDVKIIPKSSYLKTFAGL